MKLFVLIDIHSEVIAMSEIHDDIISYMNIKRLKDKDINIVPVTNDDIINSLMSKYEDLYLENDSRLDRVLTRIELKIIDDKIDEEKDKILSTINDIEHYIRDLSLSKKEKSMLLNTHDILCTLVKKKRLKKILKLNKFIKNIESDNNILSSLRESLNVIKNHLFIFTRKDDKN